MYNYQVYGNQLSVALKGLKTAIKAEGKNPMLATIIGLKPMPDGIVLSATNGEVAVSYSLKSVGRCQPPLPPGEQKYFSVEKDILKFKPKRSHLISAVRLAPAEDLLCVQLGGEGDVTFEGFNKPVTAFPDLDKVIEGGPPRKDPIEFNLESLYEVARPFAEVMKKEASRAVVLSRAKHRPAVNSRLHDHGEANGHLLMEMSETNQLRSPVSMSGYVRVKFPNNEYKEPVHFDPEYLTSLGVIEPSWKGVVFWYGWKDRMKQQAFMLHYEDLPIRVIIMPCRPVEGVK